MGAEKQTAKKVKFRHLSSSSCVHQSWPGSDLPLHPQSFVVVLRPLVALLSWLKQEIQCL